MSVPPWCAVPAQPAAADVLHLVGLQGRRGFEHKNVKLPAGEHALLVEHDAADLAVFS